MTSRRGDSTTREAWPPQTLAPSRTRAPSSRSPSSHARAPPTSTPSPSCAIACDLQPARGRPGSIQRIPMFIDGIEIGSHAVIVALGVTKDGTKEPLGVWCGSTENHVVTAALMQNLIERGLRVDAPVLFVIDGGKGIRKALTDVFGDRAVVQRCQVHKARNVRDHLPEERRAYVRRQMRDAYRSRSASTAKKLLLQVVSWLEANGEDAAAGSLREGLDETLTVLRLNLPATLCRTFATTNAIENLNGTLRRVIRN